MSAGESLWHGYSTDDVDRLAWAVVDGDGRAGEADAYELFEIAWFAVVGLLVASDQAPCQADLVAAGRTALDATRERSS